MNMISTDFAITGTQGRVNRKQDIKAILAFAFLFVAVAITSTIDTSKAFGSNDLNGIGKDYSIKAGNTQIGFYTEKNLFSFGGGNTALGFTIGLDKAGLFGSFHNGLNCYGSCDE